MVDKAMSLPVDEIVLDLEDAVSAGQKDSARTHVARVLAAAPSEGPALSVRINGLGTPWFDGDLAMIAGAGSAVASVVVPKVESAQDIDVVRGELRNSEVPVQALIESPRGIEAAAAICGSRGVESVIIGYADLGAALGRARGLPPSRWISLQERVLLAARAAGISAVDGPHLGVADDEEFRASTRWIREMGYDGKWVIHPAQIPHVMDEFTPSAAEVDHAQRVLRALREANVEGRGAVQFEGRMLDEALAVSARRVLSQSARSGRTLY